MTMDYKSIFDKAMSWKLSEYTFSENKVLRNIEERAKNMKKNDNVKQKHFTEITSEYAEPKKSHKALNVFAGVAGTAAVLTGAVFGLNWLNEHGGLKGPDVQGPGAGYHEDVTEPVETTPVTTDALIAVEENTEPKNILQSVGDVLEFSNMTAKISKYDYDGQYLRVMVEAEYHYPVSEVEGVHRLGLHVKDNDKYDVGEYCLNDYQYVTAKYYQEIAEMIWNDPNVENWDESADMERIGNTLMYDIGIYIRLDPGQTAELQFEYHPAAVGIEWEYAGNYTLTGIDTTDALCTVTNSVTNTTVSVSKWGVLVEGPYNLEEIENFSLAVKYKDGMEKILADRSTKPEHNPSNDIPYYEFPAYYTDLGRGRDYIMSSLFMEGKIDVENIASVVVNGEEIGVASNVERESFISIEFRDMKAEFEFTYYIDGELQENMTETRDMSDKQYLEWNVKGTGIHKYEIFFRNTDTDASGKLLDMDIDFSKDPPERTINDDSLATDLYSEIVEREEKDALDQLKSFAGEDYCFPLENWTKDVITYRTHDAWAGEERSTDYRFNIPAEEGEAILAVTGGIVIETHPRNVPGQGEGIYITIQAPDGRKWRYSHLSDIFVSEGDTVKSGDRIAAAGATCRATGPLVCISFPDSEVIDPAGTGNETTE